MKFQNPKNNQLLEPPSFRGFTVNEKFSFGSKTLYIHFSSPSFRYEGMNFAKAYVHKSTVTKKKITEEIKSLMQVKVQIKMIS